MNIALIWRNLAAYSMQIGLLVGLAALAPAVLRLRTPRALLAYWHVLLAACLALPLVQSWRHDTLLGGVDVSSTIGAARGASQARPWNIPAAQLILWMIVAGVAFHLVKLAAGCIRLSWYRRRSRTLSSELPFPAEVRLSSQVASPVTFGFLNPVILVPPAFPSLDPHARAAILVHECLHIERRDWLFTVAEEIVRSLLWFHPAIWWLLGEIQLTREQAVDREVIHRTGARDEYLDALLAIAGAGVQSDLAPAPLFLRRRHLKQRVLAILKDGRVSRRRVLTAMAVSLVSMVAVCRGVTAVFPLTAGESKPSHPAPARIRVGGNIQSDSLVFQPRPFYPAEAKQKRISGQVHMSAIIGKDGAVRELQVLSGHPLLAPAALKAVRQWIYRPTLLNGNPVEVSTVIDVNFTLTR
jgi:TonB family protein